MAKHKSPSVLNSRTVRVNLGDYLMLTEISRKLGKTMAEALHLVITNQARQEAIVTPRTQIPMPITTAYALVPAPEHPSYRAIPITAIATNGSKAAAFRIRPKGVRHD